MKAAHIFLIFFVIAIQTLLFADEPLKIINSIGDERDDYTIFGMADVVLTETKDIYILNTRGNFISQYDWNGNFVRRIGQKGQGPKDFFYPNSLAYHKNKLYVHDRGNHRLVEINLNTMKFQYFKDDIHDGFNYIRFVLDKNRLLGNFDNIKKSRGRIGITDKNFNIHLSFFEQFPIELEKGDYGFKDGMAVEKVLRVMLINNRFEPTYDYNEKTKEILVSFRHPDNIARYFVYNTDGTLLKKFSYTVKDKKYKFNRLFIDNPSKVKTIEKWPPRYEIYQKVFIYEDNYIVILSLDDYKAKEKLVSNRHSFLLIFDQNGKFLKQYPVDDHLSILRQCNGYLLGTIWEQEIDKCYIYKLDINSIGDNS